LTILKIEKKREVQGTCGAPGSQKSIGLCGVFSSTKLYLYLALAIMEIYANVNCIV